MISARVALLLCFLTFCNISVSKPVKPTIVTFGPNNQLIINPEYGLYTVKYGQRSVIIDAEATYIVNEKKYRTSDYLRRDIKIENVKDNIGSGKLVILTSSATGLPIMIQRFYCYPNRNYVITDLQVEGKDLSSNYMSPLITTKAGFSGKNFQTLFVPFDNDTFIRYSTADLAMQPMVSAEVGAIYDRQSRKGLIVGSVTQDTWKSGVKSAGSSTDINQLEVWGGLSEVKITRDSMPHGSIKGDKLLSPKVFIGYFSDWRIGLEDYAKACKILTPPYIKPWAKATPIGWNSWGVIGTKLSYEKATGVVDFFVKEIPEFRNEDGTAYIDLDSFWDNMVRGGFNGDFTKLKQFVEYCQARNLQPGVYWAPFTDWGFKSTNMNRLAEGGNYKFADMWIKTTKGYHDLDGGRALDPTHPGTKARITFVLSKLKDCGFKMIKIDFLGHAAAESVQFYDPKVTTGMQAYKMGMETIATVLDNSMLVYAAISPSLATAPYVHMRRIACDAFKSIKDTEYTLNSISYGWWQTHLYDYVDADHLVFENESAGANRARLISGLVSGPVILGDDYSLSAEWQSRIKAWLQTKSLKPLIASGKSFTPIDDGEAGGGASNIFIRKNATGTYLAIFNYKKQPVTIEVSTSRLGLLPNKQYQLTELLGADAVSGTSKFKFSFTGEGAYIFKISAK